MPQTDNADLALISQPEVLKLFGVSPMTLWRWRKAKGFPPEVRVASRVYFRRADVAQFLDANTAHHHRAAATELQRGEG